MEDEKQRKVRESLIMMLLQITMMNDETTIIIIDVCIMDTDRSFKREKKGDSSK